MCLCLTICSMLTGWARKGAIFLEVVSSCLTFESNTLFSGLKLSIWKKKGKKRVSSLLCAVNHLLFPRDYLHNSHRHNYSNSRMWNKWVSVSSLKCCWLGWHSPLVTRMAWSEPELHWGALQSQSVGEEAEMIRMTSFQHTACLRQQNSQ